MFLDLFPSPHATRQGGILQTSTRTDKIYIFEDYSLFEEAQKYDDYEQENLEINPNREPNDMKLVFPTTLSRNYTLVA